MGRIVYCQGRFVPEDQARVSIFDRGFLFGDAVYEVTAVLNGSMIDNDLHMARLERSLAALNIPMPMPRAEIERVQAELIGRNGVREGTVYLQVSRGEADRDFVYPVDLPATVIAFTQARRLTGTKGQTEGVAVDLAPDPRWARRDIKTTMLLGQVMAKVEARKRHFDDVWLVGEDGFVTEGASSTAFIVTRDGRIRTRANSQTVLAGCTRRALLRLCEEEGTSIEEEPFTPQDAQSAAEAFLTSASSFVMPVVRIGDATIGDGRPGPLTRRLQALYFDTALGTAASRHAAAP
ncbi:D-amino-acid transaminase [Mesorhizobium sp. BAC0120]|uniref:D-amino-acid transaminase n=1 Tax=Mesorhizobium sp. BAC0120 TaxID=3090670 RepID=UPI00298BF652|nr:D-amino-acid transaminase [Mesorhizobium sp. BAC0120]MDW6025762.1 D-amino-acid transaminase [Mesorhizobium sp. BAC0120]